MTTTEGSAARASAPSAEILALVLALGILATLVGWAVLSLGGPEGLSPGPALGGASPPLAPPSGSLTRPMDPIPDVVSVETRLPVRARAPDVVSAASRR